MSGGGGGTTQTVQKADPWAGQQPALKYLYEQAPQLPEREYFPGSTVVPFAPQTQQALDLAQQRALSGSPLRTGAAEQVQKTLGGEYLYGGEGFNQAFEAARRKILPTVGSEFERAGRYGSGLHRGEVAGQLGEAFTGLYEPERQRQMAAAAFAPGLASTEYEDIGKLAGIGGAYESLERERLAEQIGRHEFEQAQPYEQLAAQSAIIQGGFPGGTTTTQTPYYRNQLANTLGMGASGLGMAGQLGMLGGGAAPIVAPAAAAGSIPGLSSVFSAGAAAAPMAKSAKEFKEDFTPIDHDKILELVEQLKVEAWRYKDEPDRHIGPYAEEFNEAFGLDGGKYINVVDMMGVLMASVKSLSKQVKELKCLI